MAIAVLLGAVLAAAPVSTAAGAKPPPAAQSSAPSDADTCRRAQALFEADLLAFGNQQYDVTAHADCKARQVDVAMTVHDPKYKEVAFFAAFAMSGGVCLLDRKERFTDAGWKVTLSVRVPGVPPASVPIDCTAFGGDGKPRFVPGTPEALAAGIPAPPETVRKVLDVRIGEAYADTLRRSTLKLPAGDQVIPQEEIDIVLRHGDSSLRFDKIGGFADGHAIVELDTGLAPSDTDRVTHIEFRDQDRPLKLRELVERAEGLEAWFAAHRFQACPGDDYGRFRVRDPYKLAGQRTADWAGAETLLADEAADVKEMHLFTLCAADATVDVDAANWRRAAHDFGVEAGKSDLGNPIPYGATIFDGNGGYEWGLTVFLTAPSDR